MRRLELDELINIQMKLQDHCDSVGDCYKCQLRGIVTNSKDWGGEE